LQEVPRTQLKVSIWFGAVERAVALGNFAGLRRDAQKIFD
jgi:hypothetical protein